MYNDPLFSKWLKEDVPYFDLTTHALEIGHFQAEMSFYSRERGVLSGAEEVEALCKGNDLTIKKKTKSGQFIQPHESFFIITGTFQQLYKIYKVAQNIFEYASGIASKTNKLVQLVKEMNKDIPIFTTRKTFPGTKELVIKSILAGGAIPHRLGLSETILIFKHHVNFFQSERELHDCLTRVKKQHCGKKIFIEAESVEDAIRYASLPIDGIQYDKLTTDELKSTIVQIRKTNPNLVHLAVGGINEKNIQAYALTDVDGIVTSSVYYSNPLDIGVNITPISAV